MNYMKRSSDDEASGWKQEKVGEMQLYKVHVTFVDIPQRKMSNSS